MTLLTPQKTRLVPVLLQALFLVLASMAPARAEISKEYQVKALFLFNFARFVQWPSGDFHKPDQPFCIGLLGDDPFDGFIDETVKGERVNGRPFIVHRFAKDEPVQGCQILFIGRSEKARLSQILEGLKGKHILTVGDDAEFAEDGGAIGFFLERNKIRFKVNLGTAKRDHLVLSSKILRLAEIAGKGGERP